MRNILQCNEAVHLEGDDMIPPIYMLNLSQIKTQGLGAKRVRYESVVIVSWEQKVAPAGGSSDKQLGIPISFYSVLILPV